jgi:hypothetical protein
LRRIGFIRQLCTYHTFVKLSSGVALPCADGTKAPASGYVNLDMHGGMVRIQEANVMMTVLCGYDEDFVDKPRVVAKSVLKMKALFDNKYVAKIYETLQEFVFDTVEITIAAIQGNNGWFWNMDVAFVLPISFPQFKMDFSGTLSLTSRMGLPSENIKIAVDISADVSKYFTFKANGSYVLGAICRPSDGDRNVELGGVLQLKSSPKLKTPPLYVDIALKRGCPVYENDSSNDKYSINYVLEGRIEGYEIVQDRFVVNNGSIALVLTLDQDLKSEGFHATIEGNVTAMYDGSDPDLPFDFGYSANLWVKTTLTQFPDEDGVMSPVQIGQLEFNALFYQYVSASAISDGNATSADETSGFAITAQVQGVYPCGAGQKIVGDINLKIKISDKFNMDFGLDGHITFHCGVTDATRPKFKASVYTSMALDSIPGFVLDNVGVTIIAYHDVENDAWSVQGTVEGSVVANVNSDSPDGGDASIGAGIRFTFDTRTSYWSVMTSVTYTSDHFNITVSAGTEDGNCTKQGTFVDGTISMLPSVPSYNASIPTASGTFSGVVRCGEAAIKYGKYQLSASIATLLFPIGDKIFVFINDLQLEFDVMIPDGMKDDLEFAEHDFYFRVVGSIMLGTNYEFPGAEILNALVSKVGVDLYCEYRNGVEFNPEEHLNVTMYTIMKYKLEAEEGSWQETDGVDRLFISSYLRISYPCPYDGIMAGFKYLPTSLPNEVFSVKYCTNPQCDHTLFCLHHVTLRAGQL